MTYCYPESIINRLDSIFAEILHHFDEALITLPIM